MDLTERFHFGRGTVDAFLGLLDETIDWCDSSGKPMWKKSDVHARDFVSSIDPDSVVFLKHGSEIAAGMILQWVDPVFWPDSRPNESGYIHKLCVRRSFAGRQLSTLMIDYAKSRCRERRVPLLRLDTDARRPALRSLYERNGFALVGYAERGKKYCLYEMTVE